MHDIHRRILKKMSLKNFLALRNKLFHDHIDPVELGIASRLQEIFVLAQRASNPLQRFGLLVLIEMWKLVSRNVCGEDACELIRIPSREGELVGIKISILKITETSPLLEIRENTYLNIFNLMQSEVFKFLKTKGYRAVGFSFNMQDDLSAVCLCLKLGDENMPLRMPSGRIFDDRIKSLVQPLGFLS